MRLGPKRIVLSAAFIAFVPFVAAGKCDTPNQQADFAEVCRRDADDIRTEDSECEEGRSGRSWVYVVGQATQVGHRITNYSTVRPTTGTIARAPSSGGFGTYRGGTVGS